MLWCDASVNLIYIYIYTYNTYVIREADKGPAVVVMSRECYIAEAYRQLCESDVYQQVTSTVFFDVIE